MGPAETDRMANVLVCLRKAAAKMDGDAYLALRWEFNGTCYRASGHRRLVTASRAGSPRRANAERRRAAAASRDVKRLFDPNGILDPGMLLGEDQFSARGSTPRYRRCASASSMRAAAVVSAAIRPPTITS